MLSADIHQLIWLIWFGTLTGIMYDRSRNSNPSI